MHRLDRLEELAHAYFGARHQARERALAHARLLIRHAGNAIRAAHRRDWAKAGDLLAQAEAEIATIKDDLRDLPELYYHNSITDALKEYAEARLTLALVRDEDLPLPDALDVGYVAYYNGLAEAVGELRRYTLDALRRDDIATGEHLLDVMDAIYELLVTIDYPDAVTGSLRRATDGVRGILERTRGDVTTAAGQHRLELALAGTGEHAITDADTRGEHAITDAATPDEQTPAGTATPVDDPAVAGATIRSAAADPVNDG